MSNPPITAAQLRDGYRRVMDRVAAAAQRSGRKASDVIVVAVTKTAAPDQIRQLLEMGHQDFGENRVQHLTQRVAQLDEFLSRRRSMGAIIDIADGARSKPAPRLPSPSTASAQPVRWHMIGHLQRNKVKHVVPIVKLIHSVDSLRLAEELHAYGARTDRVIDVLLQVNSSGEETKFGVSSPAAPHLAEQMETMIHLRLRGLMTMAPHHEDPEQSRAAFARTAELFHEIRAGRRVGKDFNLLSMGMSGDFEVAIEEGANIVRIGRAIFGEGSPDEPDADASQTRSPRSEEDDSEDDLNVDPEARRRIARENHNAREGDS